MRALGDEKRSPHRRQLRRPAHRHFRPDRIDDREPSQSKPRTNPTCTLRPRRNDGTGDCTEMMDSQNAQLTGPHPHLKLRRVASLAVFLGLIAVLIFGTLNISKAGPQSNSAMSLSPRQIPVPPQYFDLNIMFYPGVVSPWPAAPFFSWRVWHALWFDLEPQKGQWNWKHLDELTANNAAHNSEMMLIMSYSPMWATQK